jgi:hypothetical protein
MTVQEVVLDLLSYANIYGFELGGTDKGEDEGEVVKGVAAVNQSLELIFLDGPESLKYDSRSSFLNVPTTITLNLTQGQNTATMLGNFAPWMRGCSVRIDGDAILNRIKDAVFDNQVPGETIFTLLRAYTGATGAHTGTVYSDSLLLDADVMAVLEPVTLAPNTRLHPAQTKGEFMGSQYWRVLGGSRNAWCYILPWYTTWEKTAGVPQQYRVEQMQDTARKGGGSLYLGLNPMPTQLGNVNYDIYRKPVPIDRTMMNEEGGNDPAIDIPCLPPDMIESFLLPFARWKYVSAHPNVQNREIRASLKSEYDEAVQRLRNGASLTPQLNITRARYL